MNSTIRARLPALLVPVCLLASLTPAYAGEPGRPGRHVPRRAMTTTERLNLYAPRVRRSTINYLELRLLELREEGLDRAAAAIERRLSIDDLLATPATRPHPSGPVHAKAPAPPPA